MKKLLIILAIPLCGCAYLNSNTTRKYPITIGTNTVMCIETTHGRAITFLDANSSLTKFRNQSSPSSYGSTNGTIDNFAPGTYASGINETSTTTNAAATINALTGLLEAVGVTATK